MKSPAVSLVLLAAILLHVTVVASSRKPTNSVDYEKVKYKALFPKRKSDEAAVVEWGHSAIISALDAVVANFGPQTAMGASFEVETAPILADPIDGYTNLKPRSIKNDNNKDDENEGHDPHKFLKQTIVLKNAESIDGNMCVMTNSAGMSGVHMAKVAKDSGAVALMVVNVLDPDNPDSVYPLQCESDEECEYAQEHIDIPIFMVSLSSGNVLTTAMDDDETSQRSSSSRQRDPQSGMPDRVRLYAGGDRPFFEDVRHEDPVVYLIHNLLTEQECDMLIQQANPKVEPFDDTKDDILEGTATATASKEGGSKSKTANLERAFLWNGALKSQSLKAIDERMEQVTGFPQAHFSDFQVNKFTKGSYHSPHYDSTHSMGQLASIHIFLTDGDDLSGGEFVFPYADRKPIKITPKRGMAVVYHNLDQEGGLDWSSAHGELPVKGDDNTIMWTARKWVLTEPLPKAHSVALPAFALLFGGKLPNFVKVFYEKMMEQFGVEQGNLYFEKCIVFGPVFLLLLLVSSIGSALTRYNNTEKNKKGTGTTKSGSTKNDTNKKSN
jgi:hypothetical protein